MFFERQEVDVDIYKQDTFKQNYNMPDQMMGCPIIEPPIQKCVKRDIIHEVNHICPVCTKIINNHIYKHNYIPEYSCCEENIVTNIDQGSCCQFR